MVCLHGLLLLPLPQRAHSLSHLPSDARRGKGLQSCKTSGLFRLGLYCLTNRKVLARGVSAAAASPGPAGLGLRPYLPIPFLSDTLLKSQDPHRGPPALPNRPRRLSESLPGHEAWNPPLWVCEARGLGAGVPAPSHRAGLCLRTGCSCVSQWPHRDYCSSSGGRCHSCVTGTRDVSCWVTVELGLPFGFLTPGPVCVCSERHCRVGSAVWPLLSQGGSRRGAVRGPTDAHVLGLPVSGPLLGGTSGSAWVTVLQVEDPESSKKPDGFMSHPGPVKTQLLDS